jgi:hypothetical protein
MGTLFETNGFAPISYKTAIDFLIVRHYSGRKPTVNYAFGYYEKNLLKAVCTFGKPASNSLCTGVCGEELSPKVYELNRLCTDGDMNIPLSEFVSWCLRQLKKHNLIIVSYADTQMYHNGYIYQACNFLYTGKTKERTDKYTEGGKHSRHYDKENNTALRKVRSAKHRYIYFSADRKTKKQYLSKLNYRIEQYPKGENKKYVLGQFIQPLVIESDVAKR